MEDEIDWKKQHYCEIQVIDNGIGIAREKLPFVFEPHFTDKESGSGIGLAITKKIVEDHDGRISISSTPGLGTTVNIILPIRSESIG